jgi:uncharacterized protein
MAEIAETERPDDEHVNCLDVVLKVAERCNLACPYCYYFYKENDLHRGAKAVMAEPTMREVVSFLRRGAIELDIRHLYIGLHGGEPTLLPKERFDRLCTMLREGLEDVTRVHLGMQTNGTLLDEEWIDLFARHRVMVGVSLDGPPHIHDAARPDHRGRGSYANAVRGLELLQRAAAEGRTRATGVLCVANPEHGGAEVLRHLVEDLGVRNLNLLFPRDGHDSEIWKPQSRWIAYFAEVLRYWRSAHASGHPFTLYLVSDLLSAMAREESAIRLDKRRSNRHSIITIGGQGHLGPDDNIMALDKALCREDVTIWNTSLAQFFASPLWSALRDAVDQAPERCATCEWYRTCRSGELYNRYSRETGFGNPSVFCETLDYLHTQLAAIVAERQGGVDGLARILRQAPTQWARDFFAPRGLEVSTSSAQRRTQSLHLPVVR